MKYVIYQEKRTSKAILEHLPCYEETAWCYSIRIKSIEHAQSLFKGNAPLSGNPMRDFKIIKSTDYDTENILYNTQTTDIPIEALDEFDGYKILKTNFSSDSIEIYIDKIVTVEPSLSEDENADIAMEEIKELYAKFYEDRMREISFSKPKEELGFWEKFKSMFTK